MRRKTPRGDGTLLGRRNHSARIAVAPPKAPSAQPGAETRLSPSQLSLRTPVAAAPLVSRMMRGVWGIRWWTGISLITWVKSGGRRLPRPSGERGEVLSARTPLLNPHPALRADQSIRAYLSWPSHLKSLHWNDFAQGPDRSPLRGELIRGAVSFRSTNDTPTSPPPEKGEESGWWLSPMAPHTR